MNRIESNLEKRGFFKKSNLQGESKRSTTNFMDFLGLVADKNTKI